MTLKKHLLKIGLYSRKRKDPVQADGVGGCKSGLKHENREPVATHTGGRNNHNAQVYDNLQFSVPHSTRFCRGDSALITIYVGTSGWSYDHWQGLLYSENTPVGKRLPYYLARYDTVEVNSTYYRWPNDSVFAGWQGKLPPGFVMSVKAARGLSHYARLNNPQEWMDRMTQGMRGLGAHLGVFLVQLPPQVARNDARLEGFLRVIPPGLKVTLEFRHPSWDVEEVYALLERYGAAYCVMSGANLPCVLRATAPFVYVRFHGPDTHALYAGSYSDNDLHWWADRFREWQAQGRDIYAYFNNDGGGNALRNADTLKRFLAI